MLTDPGAAEMIYQLHGLLLRRIAFKTGVHFEGLRSAGCYLRRKYGLDNKTFKKLKGIDDANSVCRHIDSVKAKELLTSVDVVLSQEDSGNETPTSAKAPSSTSTSRPSSICSSPTTRSGQYSSAPSRDSPPAVPTSSPARTTQARLAALSYRNLVADYEAAHFDIFSDEHDGCDHEMAPQLVAPLALCPLAPFVETQLLHAFAQLLATVSESSSHIEEVHDRWRCDSDEEVSINIEELTVSTAPTQAPESYDILSNITHVASALARFRDAFAFAHGSTFGFDSTAIEAFVQNFAFIPADWDFISIIADELGINSCMDGIAEIVEQLDAREDRMPVATFSDS